MAGRDRASLERLGPLDERRELQVAVAVHARNRRPSRRVLADEVGHDVLLEAPLEVDDVVGDADRARHTARVVQIVERAAAPEADLSVIVSAGRLIVQLHRETDHLVPPRASSAAATDESTPPDIATTIFIGFENLVIW